MWRWKCYHDKLPSCCSAAWITFSPRAPEQWREEGVARRIRQPDRYRRRILTIEAGVEVVEVVRCCWVKARGGRLLLVASNTLETLPNSAGIVWQELAFKLAPVVSFRCPYRSFDIVLDFLCGLCTVAALQRVLLLFQFYYKVSEEQWLIDFEHYKCVFGNAQILAEAYVRCHIVCIFMNVSRRVFKRVPVRTC